MIPLLVILEIIILCVGATVFLYSPKMMVSEAICSGIIVALLTLSCLYQTVFLIEIPQLAFVFEFLLIIASLILVKRRSNYLKVFQGKITEFYQQNKILGSLVGIVLIYLLLQTLLLPPTGPDSHSYHLPRVLLFQQEKSLYLENITTIRQAIFAVGWNILNHSFLRFYTDYGLGIFNFLIYLAIGLGIYALSRKITSQKIATVSTLAVISMPQIVLASTSVSTDVPLAGFSICCFLTLSRLYDELNIYDFILLVLITAFSLSVKLTCVLFFAPFIFFSSYLLIKKYTFIHLIKFITFHWKLLILLIFPVILMSQSWLYIHNAYFWGGWTGPSDYSDYFQQNDGVKGAFVNLIRYLFESVDLMLPTDLIGDYLFQIKPSDILEKIYNKLIYPLVGDVGLLNHFRKFKIDWYFIEGLSWYGILGFLLSIPSIIFSIIKGKNIIKIVGLTLLCFFLLVCYKVGWGQARGRYFSLLFVNSGICIAYSLDYLGYKLKNKINILLNFIIILSLITLLVSAVGNQDRALINFHEINTNKFNLIPKQNLNIITQNIWSKTNMGQKREYKMVAQEIKKITEPFSNLALLGHFNVNIYTYLLALPSMNIIPIHTSSYPELESRLNSDIFQKEFTNYKFPNALQSNPDSFDYLLCLDVDCSPKNTNLPHKSRELIWSFQPSQEQRRQYRLNQAQLFKLN